ncbi:MAG: D-alanyl-D-alanine carboxypeptidase family protein [[Clostridium] symbiosum]|uniref:D-alanyl-D-alanine carboxypeptidase family protein n=1 Tax=Clostridium symbiosum TaxID=1512 RepID=UPI001105F48A|nr:D-alanyl-D-alanine carboxypeptidase family protein [[Clostridium] symbiosum]
MKKLMSLLLSIIMILAGPAMTSYAKPDWPADTGIQSEAGIVMDMDSKTVIFGQNIHVQKAPASITKLLTALVVIENANLDDMVTFSDDAIHNVEEGAGNKNALEPGDKMTVKDCLYHMLLTSSNQSANALAEHVAGSRDAFVAMMNEKVKELGCENSHFANPSGLNDDTQLTTVYDMALIGTAAYENPVLLEIGSAKSYRLPPTANNPDGVTIKMEHKMLTEEDPNYYQAAIAGKTGFTSIAGQTLVTYASKDDRKLIAVTMKSTEFTHYQDTKALLDFGFDRFKNIKIAENETSYTTGDQPVELGDSSYEPSDLSIDPKAVITVPKDAQFSDTDKNVVTKLPENHPDGAVALLEYTYNDRKVGEVYIISAKQAAIDETAQAGGETPESAPEGQDSDSGKEAGGTANFAFKLPKQAPWIMLIGVLAAAGLGFSILFIKKRKEEERRLMEERRRKRRQRLEEIGCTQEEFERLLEERAKRGK